LGALGVGSDGEGRAVGVEHQPNEHAPGELVLLLETLKLEIQAKHDTVSGDYILHGSVVRGGKHSYTFAVRRVPRLSGVRAMAASLAKQGPP
jgi:hypothetical protein